MPDFSTILQTPTIRSVVQEGFLERAFHDAMFPQLLYRVEATPVPWPGAAGVGDTMIFTAPGLMAVDCEPLVPGEDPEDATYEVEQWEAMLGLYAKSMSTHMPSSTLAIANLFLRNAHQLGLQAGQTINRVVRNRMFNAALSGWTVVDGAAQTGFTIRVKRLNGLTRARNPLLPAGSKVRFNPVSASNPLTVVHTGATPAANTVVGFTPDTAGDEYGPGTVTLGTTCSGASADRAAFYSADRTNLLRVGGGMSVDALTAGTDIPTLSDIRTVLAPMQTNNVPVHGDGRFHCHLSAMSQALIFNDPEFQRLMTSLPDYYAYKQFALGELLNTVFFRNSESPQVSTVLGGSTATFSVKDPFVGELTTNGAVGGSPVHRMLFTGQGGVYEYYQDLAELITEAGLTGVVGDAQITNNGIEVLTDRIMMIIRAPLNKLQDMVSTAWKLSADWPARTDSATGDSSRYKRFSVIEHTE